MRNKRPRGANRHVLIAIASANKWRYTPAAPQGVNGKRSLKISKSALSSQPSAPTATLCLLGLGLGLGLRRPSVTLGSRLGHPWVTHGSPLGHAWVTQGSNGTSALFAI